MSARILSVRLDQESGVVLARQRARQITEQLGFLSLEQTQIATAVSEIARNAYEYAGGGLVEYFLTGKSAPQVMKVRVSDISTRRITKQYSKSSPKSRTSYSTRSRVPVWASRSLNVWPSCLAGRSKSKAGWGKVQRSQSPSPGSIARPRVKKTLSRRISSSLTASRSSPRRITLRTSRCSRPSRRVPIINSCRHAQLLRRSGLSCDIILALFSST